MSEWKPGDEANGYRLSEDGQWLPIDPSGQTATVGPPPSQAVAPSQKKKRRIFLWVFLAIQAIFIIWIIAGISGGAGAPDDCGTLDAETCNAAESIGTGIGVFVIVIFWVIVDFLLAVTYGIYRLAKRT